MSTHDSWVFLKTGSTFDDIVHLFPCGIPMRDPFPMGIAEGDDGVPVGLWMVDGERLTAEQEDAFARKLAAKYSISIDEAVANAEEYGGFSVAHEHVERLVGGPECFQRTKELADFMENHPPIDSEQITIAWTNFVEDQMRRWVDGEEEPAPFPQKFEEVDPRLQTPELRVAREVRRQLETASWFDVIMGSSLIDSLNELDPSNTWEFDS